MNEQEFQELISELNLSKTGIGWTIPGSENRKDVELFIRKHFFASESQKRISFLEAKIFAYEKIISSSNFAPVIKQVKAKNKPE